MYYYIFRWWVWFMFYLLRTLSTWCFPLASTKSPHNFQYDRCDWMNRHRDANGKKSLRKSDLHDSLKWSRTSRKTWKSVECITMAALIGGIILPSASRIDWKKQNNACICASWHDGCQMNWNGTKIRFIAASLKPSNIIITQIVNKI